MTYSDEMLSSFLDGEAEPALARQIEAAMASDPALVTRMERLGANDHLLREAFDTALGATPEALRTTLANAPATGGGAGSAEILAFRPRPRPKTAMAGNWPKLAAACVAVAVLAGAALVIAPPRSLTPPAPAADGLAPGAALAAALSKAPSGAQVPVAGEVLQVALSFKGRDGRMCRQFRLGSAASSADGVACHGARGWRIEGWMAGRPQTQGGYQTAGGEDAATSAMVDRLGPVQTLDQTGEAAAIKAGWR